LLSFRRNFGMRLGLIIALSIFSWGAAAGHIHQIRANHDYAPGNTGYMLWTDLLQPLISFSLIYMSYLTSKTIYSIRPQAKKHRTFSH
jgi:hypothetical protein